MNAHCRIGKVTTRSGAVFRVVPRSPQNDVTKHIREWVSGALDCTRPPDAYAAVAYWFDAAEPGNPGITIGYATRHDAVPLAALVHMAGATLAHDFAAESGKRRTLRAYGDEPPSWTPDPAS